MIYWTQSFVIVDKVAAENADAKNWINMFKSLWTFPWPVMIKRVNQW